MSHSITISGYSGCGFFEAAVSLAERLKATGIQVEVTRAATRDEYRKVVLPKLHQMFPGTCHTTSPFVYQTKNGNHEFIGGNSEFQKLYAK